MTYREQLTKEALDLAIEHEQLLQDTWRVRPHDDVLLCLGDVRRKDVFAACSDSWGREAAERVRREASPPPMLTFMVPPEEIGCGGQCWPRTRPVAKRPGLAPLLVSFDPAGDVVLYRSDEECGDGV
jgi:hypothetical protein